MPSDLVKGEVDRRRVVLGVVHNHTPITSDGTDNAVAAALALCNLFDDRHVLGADEGAVVLLVLGAPDLEDRHSVVAKHDVAQVDCAADGLHNLLEHVAVATAALSNRETARASESERRWSV